MVHRDHQPHAGAHVDLAMRKLGDLAGPGTRCVDDNSGVNTQFLTAALAADASSDHTLAIELEVEHAVVWKDASPVRLRRARAGPDDLPGVERGVRDDERASDVGVDTRLTADRLGARDLLGGAPPPP